MTIESIKKDLDEIKFFVRNKAIFKEKIGYTKEIEKKLNYYDNIMLQATPILYVVFKEIYVKGSMDKLVAYKLKIDTRSVRRYKREIYNYIYNKTSNI